MKLTGLRADLLPAIAACAAVSEARSPSPANACVALEAFDGKLRVRSSNGLQSVRFEIPAKAPELGRALVRAADLLARVDAIGDGEISITTTDKSVELRRERARFSLALFDPKLVPPPPVVSGETCKIDAAAFVALLGRIAPETSLDVDGPFKSGVFLDAAGVQLTAWAWNGVALVRATMDADGSFNCLLPVVAIRHLRRLLAKIKGPIEVGVMGSDMFVRAERLVYTSRLPEASRPPFDALVQAAVPRSGGHRITVARALFAEAVRAVMVGQPKDSRVSLRMVEGGLLLWGRSVAGEISEQIVPVDGALDNLSVGGNHLAIAAGFYSDATDLEIRKHETPTGGEPPPLTILDPGRSDLCIITPRRLSADDLTPNLAA